jgi:hypothetical protein
MINVWREPIFDRVFDDVEFAIRKLEEWKKNHTHMGSVKVEDEAFIMEDKGVVEVDNDVFVLQNEGDAYVENGVLIVHVGDVYELKGCLNLLDLNRIESNIAFLAEKMEDYSYSPNIHGKQWSRENMPNIDDMSRIIENIRALINAFYSSKDAPLLPTTMLSYDDINAIEENIYLIKEMLDCMVRSFKKVGTIKSGSKTFLPTRR